jgi:hypothetical protein
MIFEGDEESEANPWAIVEGLVNTTEKEKKLHVYETLWKYKGYQLKLDKITSGARKSKF